MLEFYKFARQDETIVSTLTSIEDVEEFAVRAVEMAQDRGFNFTIDEAKQGMANFEPLVEAASTDDELTEFELELVAAGFPINSSGGASSIG